jgi:Cys-tRNA(Pro) deacylase
VARYTTPSTAATRLLRAEGVTFTEHLYRYEEHGGTRVAARELGAPEHAVVKTLVMEDEQGLPLLVLMHGGMEVSTKQLARQADRRTIVPCRPDAAQRHTGYMVGGTSPFGTRKKLPVFVEEGRQAARGAGTSASDPGSAARETASRSFGFRIPAAGWRDGSRKPEPGSVPAWGPRRTRCARETDRRAPRFPALGGGLLRRGRSLTCLLLLRGAALVRNPGTRPCGYLSDGDTERPGGGTLA